MLIWISPKWPFWPPHHVNEARSKLQQKKRSELSSIMLLWWWGIIPYLFKPITDQQLEMLMYIQRQRRSTCAFIIVCTWIKRVLRRGTQSHSHPSESETAAIYVTRDPITVKAKPQCSCCHCWSCLASPLLCNPAGRRLSWASCKELW